MTNPEHHEPTHIGDAVDEVLTRILPPETAERYSQLKRELKDTLDEIENRTKRTVRWLRKSNANQQAFDDLAEEKRQLIAYHKEEFQRRLRALIEELKDEAE